MDEGVGAGLATPAGTPGTASAMPRPVRPALFYLAFLLAGFGILSYQLPPVPGGVAIDSARFQALGGLDEPLREDQWRQADLPHAAPVPGAGRPWVGGYRMRFDYPATAAQEPWSILIPAYAGRVRLRVNGVLLADSQWFHSSLALNQVWPEIVPIPSALLHPGDNTLEAREQVRYGLTSYLSRIHVGPDRLLRPAYHQRRMLQVTAPQLLLASEVAFAFSLIIVWLVRRSEWSYVLFSLILFANTAGKLALVVTEPMVPEALLVAMGLLSFYWQNTLMVPFAFNFVGRRPRAAWAWLLLPAAVTATFLWLPPAAFRFFSWYIAVPGGFLAVVHTLAIFAEAALRRNDGASHVITGGVLLALLIALHDLPLLYGASDGDRLFLGHFAIPVFLGVVSGALTWRFATALNVVDRFNADLRRSVAAAEEALRASFVRQREQEHALALEAERSRLTRDLHDGLAGQLVSMVAMSRRSDVTPTELGAAARKALGDLRLVIASMADVGDDLGMMLANFRDQIEPQLRGLGVALDWHMRPFPAVERMGTTTVLELFRLLQEATINAARYSGVDRVSIAIGPSSDGVCIVVKDEGCGGANDRPGGYGLATMRRRAEAIGGHLIIESESGAGTRVILDLPRYRAGRAEERVETT
jgi:signal transduction histidine kinase